MKKISFVLFFLLLSNISNAQVNQEWVQRYSSGNDINDFAKSMAIDNSGNVYVTGYKGNLYHKGYAHNDFCTIKYNSNGDVLWIQTYNGPGNGDDRAVSITIDETGNIYVLGSSLGENSHMDFATVKYDADGNFQWVARYNGSENLYDYPVSIKSDLNGNIYVAGTSRESATADDFCLIKYNYNGVQQWVKLYNGNGNVYSYDILAAMILDSYGNIYITGSSIGDEIGGQGYTTIKYNSNGDLIWKSVYKGPFGDDNRPSDLVCDSYGNIYVTGGSRGLGTAYDYATIKYNANGDEEWVSRYTGYEGPANDFASSIDLDQNGNVYVTGMSYDIQSGYGAVTIKYGIDGNENWISRFDNMEMLSSSGKIVKVDSYGNILVAGSVDLSQYKRNYFLLKYNSEGIIQFIQTYSGLGASNGTGFDNLSCMIIDDFNNIYLTGDSKGFQTAQDFATVKYSTLSNINIHSSNIAVEFSLHQNYPNPFNPVTNIKFSLPSTQYTILKVFDIAGREIATLVNEQLKAGEYNYQFNADDYGLSSGVYFYQLSAANSISSGQGFVQTRKFVLIK